MTYGTFATVLLVAASGIFSLYRQLQKLQQGSYSLNEYFKWLKESYTLELAVSAMLYCAITVGVMKGKVVLSLVLAIALTVLRVFLNIDTHKKSDNKLAFTPRVKRLYIAAILMLGILILVSATSSKLVANEICRTLCLMLSVVTPALTIVAFGVNYVTEKTIKKFKKKQ